MLCASLGNVAVTPENGRAAGGGARTQTDTVRDDVGQAERLHRASWSPWNRTAPAPTGFYISTIYNGLAKQTSVLESMLEGIDVDDDPGTGVDGKDVRVSVFALPVPQLVDDGYVLTIHAALKVVRLGDEIKDGEFELCFGGTVNFNGAHQFRIGYYSAENEEIPRELREVVTIVPYLLYDQQPEFYLNIEPVFDGARQDVSAVLNYERAGVGAHAIMVDYFPAANTMVHVVPNLNLQDIGIEISREAAGEQTIRFRYEGAFAVNLTIEDLPEEMTFSVSLGERSFDYTASDEFNISMTVETAGADYLVRVEYIPCHFGVDFGTEGQMTLVTENRNTAFIIANDFYEPTSYFMLTNLTGEVIIRWHLGLAGHLMIDGFAGTLLEAQTTAGALVFKAEAAVTTEHFALAWDIGMSGEVSFDTGNEWVGSYRFNLTYDDLFGLLIEASMLRANDWRVSWQTAPPSFNKTGTIEFGHLDCFDVMLNGIWHHVF
jgi:hypothetical protein